jgi:hypothetical protein
VLLLLLQLELVPMQALAGLFEGTSEATEEEPVGQA